MNDYAVNVLTRKRDAAVMEKYLQLLGCRARDIVTEAEGVVESISFDLYGCVQAVMRFQQDKSKPNECPDGRWYDVKRLIVLSDPIMAVPEFSGAEIGAADKPLPGRLR